MGVLAFHDNLHFGVADSLLFGVADSLHNAYLDPYLYDNDEEGDDDGPNDDETTIPPGMKADILFTGLEEGLRGDVRMRQLKPKKPESGG